MSELLGVLEKFPKLIGLTFELKECHHQANCYGEVFKFLAQELKSLKTLQIMRRKNCHCDLCCTRGPGDPYWDIDGTQLPEDHCDCGGVTERFEITKAKDEEAQAAINEVIKARTEGSLEGA